MQSVMLLIGKTHYFTYFHLSERTILQIFVSENALFYKNPPFKTHYFTKISLFHLILERVQTVALAFDGAGELVARA